MADIYVATTGNDTTGDGSSGNPYATPGKAASVAVAGDTIFIKFGTYTLTTSSANANAGPMDLNPANESSILRVIGYDSTATITNTDANRPTISAGSVGSITVLKVSGYQVELRNLIIDANSQSSTIGIEFTQGYGCQVINCKVANCTSYGVKGAANGPTLLKCEATGCSGTGALANCPRFVACYSHDNTCPGFYSGVVMPVSCVFCIADTNTGGSTDGFVGAGGGESPGYINCVAYGNGRDGFRFANFSRTSAAINCIAEANGGYGINTGNGASKTVPVRNNATYNNTSNNNFGDSNQTANNVSLSGSPFTNAASGDFSLNNTAGAGADCRAAGIVGVMPGGLTTGHQDIGIQHQDSGGGGGGGAIGSLVQSRLVA